MREILPTAALWVREEMPFAMATVVAVTGSAPRELGASMIVSARGEVFGSVSGGCVEGALYERCQAAIAGAPALVDRFAYSDSDAFAVGLTCGGTIDVLVRAVAPASAVAEEITTLAARERAGAATSYVLSLDAAQLGCGTIAPADGASPEQPDSIRLLFGVPPRLIVVGAVEFSVALARLGAAMGMRVSVVDPREVFATAERFPQAEVVVDWPERYLATQSLDAGTAVCVLTHDTKLDVPALRVALGSAAGYVGAMGSRRTVADRRRRLIEAGVSEGMVARLRSPIGLDLGGRSPEETALSILAEIVADRHGASGSRHSQRTGPVHRDSASGTHAEGQGAAECAWMPEHRMVGA